MVLYLQDHVDILKSHFERQSSPEVIMEAFKTALAHWCDLNLWCEYLKFAAAHLSAENMINEFEQAVSEVGVSFDGHSIWSLYIDYLNSKELTDQVSQVTARSKKVVHRNGEFADKAMFEECQYLLSFEDHLTDLTSYLEFAKAELKRPSPNYPRIKNIYERAILLFSSEEELWTEYIKFSANSPKLPFIYRRAIEFFPSNASFLCGHLRSMEKFGTTLDDLIATFSKYQTVSLLHDERVQLFLTFLGVIKRKGVSKDLLIEQTRSLISLLFDYRIHNLYTSILSLNGEHEQAYKQWEAVVKANASSCSVWLQFISFCERYFPDRLQNVYKRACAAVSDYPETIFTSWLDYENINGTRHDLENAEERVAKQRQLLASRSANRALKRPHESEDEEMKDAEPNKQSKSDTELTVYVSNLDYSLTLGKLRAFMNTAFGHVKSVRLPKDQKAEGHKNRGFAYVDFTDISAYNNALSSDKIRIDGRPMFISRMNEKYDAKVTTQRDPKTLYVSQLFHNTTMDDLKMVFKDCEGICEIRPLYAKTGRFRGCAYVEFVDAESALKALILDGYELHGMRMRVQISDPSLAKSATVPKAHLIPSSIQRRHNEN